jgi:drug/metabolite transporter (DMT)-like permease
VHAPRQSPDTTEQPAAPPPARKDHVTLGILCMLGATVLFAGSSAVSKWQIERYSFIEIVFIRTFVSLLTCSLMILPRTGLKVFRTTRIGGHAVRNLTQAVAQSLIIIAFGLMPLAGAVAINFSAPLFATLFSALILREAVGAARWGALLVGFCGVLLVATPGADSFRMGAMFAIGNAVLYGAVTAAVRGMAATESAETLTMYQMVFLTGCYALVLPFGFTWPAAGDAAAMIVNGVFNAVGQYWWTRALFLAPASAVGPFYYFSLVWAMAIGFFVWGDVPTVWLLAGSAIVVASGLFLLWWETRRKKKQA